MNRSISPHPGISARTRRYPQRRGRPGAVGEAFCPHCYQAVYFPTTAMVCPLCYGRLVPSEHVRDQQAGSLLELPKLPGYYLG